MHLEIVSPDKKVYSGEVSLVQLPGTQSSFEILKNHAHIISTLRKGTIRLVEPGGNEKSFEVHGGVVENRDNTIVVLIDGM